MSKPPFILSNRKGPELWPKTIQLPTKVRVEMDAKGLSSSEIQLAEQLTRQRLDAEAGRIKQYYVRQKTAADLGITNINMHQTDLGGGLRARYASNNGYEELVLRVNASAVIAQYAEQHRDIAFGDYVVITFDWSRTYGGSDLDALVRMIKPDITRTAGWADAYSGTSSTPIVEQKWKDKTVLDWHCDDQTRSGKEYIWITLKPFKDVGYYRPQFEIMGNWFAIVENGNVDMKFELVLGDEPRWVGPRFIRTDSENSAQYLRRNDSPIFELEARVNTQFVWDPNYIINIDLGYGETLVQCRGNAPVDVFGILTVDLQRGILDFAPPKLTPSRYTASQLNLAVLH